MLFQRSTNIFDTGYYRNTDEEERTVIATSGNYNEDFSTSPVGSDFEGGENHYSPTDGENYKMLTPILVNIGNHASCFSTNQFLRYLSEILDVYCFMCSVSFSFSNEIFNFLKFA